MKETSLVMFIAALLAACTMESGNETAATTPTSEFLTQIGEPVAINYDPSVFSRIETVSMKVQESRMILGPPSFYYIPNDVPAVMEADGTLSNQYALTGIGGRVASNPTAVTTLHLAGRKIHPDGSLGEDELKQFGSHPDNMLEVWCPAPPGKFIVGAGFRVRDFNLTTIHIWTRSWDPALRKLTGPERLDRCGLIPDSIPEVEFNASGIYDPGDPLLDKALISGIGLRENNDNMQNMRIFLRGWE